MESLEYEGDPAKFGGVYLDEKISSKNAPFDQLVGPPADIPPKTRVLSVCIPNTRDAGPKKDGYMLSDWAAWWHLLSGQEICPNQRWYHSANIEGLLNREGNEDGYLHGNPYKTRKVVLNKEIYQTMLKHPSHAPRRIENDFKGITVQVFKEVLKSEALAVKASGENLLILYFGHGLDHVGGDGTGMTYYFGQSQEDQLHLADFLKQLGVEDGKPNIMLITTACFGGGWLQSPKFNISAMSGSGAKNVTRSWRASASSGQYAGTMMTTAIVDLLTSGLQADKHKHLAYVELSRLTHWHLLNRVDRRAHFAFFTFKAQDDKWGDSAQKRTGIALHVFENRWNELPSYPKDPYLHPGAFGNRDPDVPEELRAEYVGFFEKVKKMWNEKPGLFSGLFEQKMCGPGGEGTIFFTKKRRDETMSSPDTSGGPLERTSSATVSGNKRPFSSLEGEDAAGNSLRHFESLAKIYHGSYPGDNDGQFNKGITQLIADILYRGEKDPGQIAFAIAQIRYRLSQMDSATGYLVALETGLPNGKTCRQYNHLEFQRWFERQDSATKSRYNKILAFIYTFDQELFPPAQRDVTGDPYSKGRDYVATAVFTAGLPMEQLQPRMTKLTDGLKAYALEIMDSIKEEPEVRSKRQRLASAFGKTIRQLSPVRKPRKENAPLSVSLSIAVGT
jgi:hypothetical protein